MTDSLYDRPSPLPHATVGAVIGAALGHLGVHWHEQGIPERNAHIATQNMYLRSMADAAKAEAYGKFQADVAKGRLSMSHTHALETALHARNSATDADLARSLLPEATRVSRQMRVAIPVAGAALGALYGMAAYGS